MVVKKKLAIGSGVAALVLAGGVYGGVAFAQTQTSGSPSAFPSVSASSSASASGSAHPEAAAAQAAYQQFLQHLASRLNLPQSQVQSAVQGAEQDSVADAQKAGKLTQQQATRIDQAIQSGKPVGFGFFGRFGHGPRGPMRGMMGGKVVQAVSQALNLQPAQLRQQLRSGQTLQQIAAAQKVDFAKVQAAISGVLKTRLDKAVQAGKLTPQQEQNILNRATSGTFPPFGRWGHHPDRPEASSSPSAASSTSPSPSASA